jgi:hypothetical protein
VLERKTFTSAEGLLFGSWFGRTPTPGSLKLSLRLSYARPVDFGPQKELSEATRVVFLLDGTRRVEIKGPFEIERSESRGRYRSQMIGPLSFAALKAIAAAKNVELKFFGEYVLDEASTQQFKNFLACVSGELKACPEEKEH